VKTEDPNVCVTVNCKVCRSAIVLYYSYEYKVPINPIQNPSIITILNRDIIKTDLKWCGCGLDSPVSD
jgi:hypothetical protein